MPINISAIHYNKIIFVAECMFRNSLKGGRAFMICRQHQGLDMDFHQNRQKSFPIDALEGNCAILSFPADNGDSIYLAQMVRVS